MGRRTFTKEFKLEAVRLVTERGVAFAQAARDLGHSPERVAQLGEGICCGSAAFVSRHGQMKPEAAEIAALKREVAKLKAERDILKKAAAYFAKENL
jgi:transposase